MMNAYECNGTIIFMSERWNVPFNEAKPSWMVHFIFHRMKNEKTFIICFIKLVQRFKLLNKFKRKTIEKWF